MGSVVKPVLANQFEGRSKVSVTSLRKLGAEGSLHGRWTFPDGSRLVFIRGTWRALAPAAKKRRV